MAKSKRLGKKATCARILEDIVFPSFDETIFKVPETETGTAWIESVQIIKNSVSKAIGRALEIAFESGDEDGYERGFKRGYGAHGDGYERGVREGIRLSKFEKKAATGREA